MYYRVSAFVQSLHALTATTPPSPGRGQGLETLSNEEEERDPEEEDKCRAVEDDEFHESCHGRAENHEVEDLEESSRFSQLVEATPFSAVRGNYPRRTTGKP